LLIVFHLFCTCFDSNTPSPQQVERAAFLPGLIIKVRNIPSSFTKHDLNEMIGSKFKRIEKIIQLQDKEETNTNTNTNSNSNTDSNLMSDPCWYIRIDHPSSMKHTLNSLSTLTIGSGRLVLNVLTGRDEQKYWTRVREMMEEKKLRMQKEQQQRNRGERGMRGGGMRGGRAGHRGGGHRARGSFSGRGGSFSGRALADSVNRGGMSSGSSCVFLPAGSRRPRSDDSSPANVYSFENKRMRSDRDGAGGGFSSRSEFRTSRSSNPRSAIGGDFIG
jgi:hypothetical protein